ncbi:MAG TPA: hypothetical protein VMA32_07080 [Streptosporangiaceae bacterium]|nr:hypothetical protein [Streptosporangiaceae bacterium]
MTPRFVHGVCQLVTVIMSGETSLRPAPHIPVNSLHRGQNPSRAATGSWLGNPQSGQAGRAPGG